ncbi:hypothetical protein EG339_02720 [Chryseobacterium bernardetii]|uniref:Uncharacterized protein n=1 Tax=Chryseobacterium bernardetii TaxID=1241978 RepID=A0A3G6TC30_9FLAO|nr:hypothetical protein [Chryseobacterium bernardetii]AZB23610.1 hypothetical protein EG339_02720 [Chryseobacterium bernardetii]
MNKDEIIDRLKYLNDNIDVMSQSPSSSNDLSKGQVTLYLYSYSEKEREDLFKIIDEFDHNLQVSKNNSYKQEKALLEKKLKRIL